MKRIIVIGIAFALSACGGGSNVSGAPDQHAPTTGRAVGSTTGTAAAGSDIVWIADVYGTLGTGGVTGYSVSVGSNAITPIPGDTIDESRPNLNSKAAGINGPESLAFDAKGNLWVGSQLDSLVVATTLGTGGATPTVSVPSGLTFPQEPNALAFDPSGNLWVGGRQIQSTTIAWTYGAYSVGANLATTALTTSVPATSFKGVVPTGLAFDRHGALWALGISPNGGTGEPDGLQSYTVNGGTATPATYVPIPDCFNSDPGAYAFDLANNIWCVSNKTTTIEEFSNPGGMKLASFPVPKPTGVDVSSSYRVQGLQFDPTGTLWALVGGAMPTSGGYGIPSYAGLIALGPTGTTLSMISLPNGTNDFSTAFVFQP